MPNFRPTTPPLINFYLRAYLHGDLPTYMFLWPVSIGVHLSNACHYWRILVQCLSPSAYICPTPVTIDVYLSNACHYRRIFVQCLSLWTYICPMPVTIGAYLSNACPKSLKNIIIPLFFTDLELIPGTLQIFRE